MDDLQRAQSSLSRALGRARAGEDKELGQRVRELGEQLTHMLSGLLKLTRVHDPGNRAFDGPVKEFGSALASLVELLGTVHLVTVEDQIYVNDLRTRDDGKTGQRDLGSDLRRHNVGGLSFHAGLDGAQIRALVAALTASPAAEGARARVAANLQERGVTTVELQGIFRFQTVRRKGAPAAPAERREPVDLVDRLLHVVADSWNHLLAGRVLNPLPLRRVVMEAIDLGIESPTFWEPRAEAPAHAGHGLQICAVALLLAKRAGLPLSFLQDLGISALTHDAGYVSVPEGAGAEGLRLHAFEGARCVLRQRGFSEAKVRRLRAVLEHHRDYADPAGPPSVGGAILRVAEDYVNATRLYGAKVTRSDALGAMVKGAGRLYHPILPQLLVNALGRWPPGTLVELDGKRYGRVAVPARGEELWDKPLVRRLDPTTRALTEEWIDLAQGGRVVRAFPG
jgi:HD-GYP domain-containing protein (c-di-GMP phosphodiesterase class II)